MKCTIEQSTPEDLDLACYLFNEAINYQKKKGLPSYAQVDRKSIEKDILEQESYKVLIGNDIACMFSLSREDEFLWQDQKKQDALYLHKANVNPMFKGMGMMARIVDHTIRLASENGISVLRLDTWAENPELIAYYEQHGFEEVGHVQCTFDESLPLNTRGNLVILMERQVK